MSSDPIWHPDATKLVETDEAGTKLNPESIREAAAAIGAALNGMLSLKCKPSRAGYRYAVLVITDSESTDTSKYGNRLVVTNCDSAEQFKDIFGDVLQSNESLRTVEAEEL